MSCPSLYLAAIIVLVGITASGGLANDTPINVTVNSDSSPFLKNELQSRITRSYDKAVNTVWLDQHLDRCSEVIGVLTDNDYANESEALSAIPVVQPPSISSTNPGQNDQNVSVSTNIEVTFDIDVIETTLTTSSIVVVGSMSGRHTGTISYNDVIREVTFDPSNDFMFGESVEVTLTTDIESSSGTPMDNSYSWNFTILSASGPASFDLIAVHAVGTQPCWVTGGDIDGDNDIDLVTANDEADSITVLLNNGSGVFDIDSSYYVGEYPQSVVLADFDADGNLDVATADGDMDVLFVMFGNGDGTFIPHVAYVVDDLPWTLVAADFNGDGYTDLANTNYWAHNVSVLLNDGDGTFGMSTEYAVADWSYPISIIAGDFDGDADFDLAVAQWGGSVSILLNDGNGMFSLSGTISLGPYPVSIRRGDFDHDNDLDLVVARFVADTLALLENDGNGVFSPVQHLLADTFTVSAYCADWDGDGHLDIASGSSGLSDNDSVAIFINDGSGEYPTKDKFITGNGPYCIFAADFDGDGDLDMATSNYASDDLTIFRNGSAGAPGDADGSGFVDIDDVVYLINYIFAGGPEPTPAVCYGDADGSGFVDIDDVVYLINYIFAGGPPPVDIC